MRAVVGGALWLCASVRTSRVIGDFVSVTSHTRPSLRLHRHLAALSKVPVNKGVLAAALNVARKRTQEFDAAFIDDNTTNSEALVTPRCVPDAVHTHTRRIMSLR